MEQLELDELQHLVDQLQRKIDDWEGHGEPEPEPELEDGTIPVEPEPEPEDGTIPVEPEPEDGTIPVEPEPESERGREPEPEPESEPESEPEPEPEPPVIPASAARYRCVKKCQVRTGVEMNSDKACVLAAGTLIDVLETGINQKGKLRIRYNGGWVSERSATGVPSLEPADDEAAEPPARAPAPEPEPESEPPDE